MREIAFPREEHANWLPNTKVSTENIYVSNIVQTKQVVLRNIYVLLHTFMYIYMCICIYVLACNDN